MKNMKKVLAGAALAAALALCLLPRGADAAPRPAALAEEAAPERTVVDEGGTFYAEEGYVVFNNGGVVYNNGATVYNNGGLAYNNEGTAYNNGGTVYANGGTVYNNGGVVYDNGAEIIDNGGQPQEAGGLPQAENSLPEGYSRVSFAGDYEGLLTVEGMEETQNAGFYLAKKDSVCALVPAEGVVITQARAEGGTVAGDDGRGGYVLIAQEDDVSVSLEFKTAAPVIETEPGTYIGAQELRITAAAGTDVFYTTDGGEPTEEDQRYGGPVLLKEGAIIRAVAIAPGAEPSDIAETAVAIVAVTGPEFEPAEEGYAQPEARPISIENRGTADAQVLSVALSGADAGSFRLSRSGGGTVKAGGTEEDLWTVRPVKGLAAGEYTAKVTVELEGGQRAALDIIFAVKEAAEQ